MVRRLLEKKPSDRPADANAFRRELLETAEKLGFEHAAITSGPDLRMLREVATQSPSGRLVVDISRLRERGVFTSSADDLTVVKAPGDVPADLSVHRPEAKLSFPRVNVDLPARSTHRALKLILAALLLIAFIMVAAVALFTLRFWPAYSSTPNANAVASPSPTVQPSASPSPMLSPPPSPKRDTKGKPENTNTNANKKKDDSFFGKIKRGFRIFKGKKP